jgi:hypothetical protein
MIVFDRFLRAAESSEDVPGALTSGSWVDAAAPSFEGHPSGGLTSKQLAQYWASPSGTVLSQLGQ